MVSIPAQKNDPFSEKVIYMMKEIEEIIKNIPGMYKLSISFHQKQYRMQIS